MGGFEENLLKLIDKKQKAKPATVTTGTVTEVDLENYTCTVTRVDRPTLFDVRLNAVEFEGDRMVAIPAEESEVLVCIIEDESAEAYLLATSSITEVLIKTAQTTYKINADGHTISKADESLKKILNDVVDQVLKIYAPKDVEGLMAIKQRINNLLK